MPFSSQSKDRKMLTGSSFCSSNESIEGGFPQVRIGQQQSVCESDMNRRQQSQSREIVKER
jgi:hypothetical protein